MHNNMMDSHQWGMGFGPTSIISFPLSAALLGLILLVVLALKGYALWHAAKRDEKWWFIALLIINTVGLLELFYLIFWAKVWFNNSGSTK